MQVKNSSTIHVSLTPVLSQFVEGLLESGLYGNVSEILREALREKYQKQILELQKLKNLQNLVQVKINQMNRAEFSNEGLNNILAKIKN